MKLHHKISGEGSPLIILHGLFGTLENWGGQIAAFKEHYQVISVDLRNHGRSPHSNEMNYPVMANDIIELMDDLSIDTAHILGHSMGGKVAMQIALQHPHRINKLVVVDISPVTYGHRHNDIFEGLSIIDLDNLTSRSQADTLLKPYVETIDIRSFLLKNLYRDEQKNFKWRPNLKVLQNSYPQLISAPFGNQVLKPVLFIKGKNSDYITSDHQEAINQLFAKVSFKMIEGAGHWPHAEKAKVFGSIVLNFLR
jgi:esterase